MRQKVTVLEHLTTLALKAMAYAAGKISDLASTTASAMLELKNEVTTAAKTAEADKVTFADGETFQAKYDAGELTGPPGATGPAGPAGPQGATGAQGKTGATGAKGVTFTPAVSSAGVISWTNDGGLENPSSVSIKGPQGAAGATGTQGPTGPQGPAGPTGPAPTVKAVAAGTIGTPGTPTVTASQSGSTVTLTFDHLKGAPGAQGAAGAAGATGPQGPAGAQGPAGPNTVSTSTTTGISGLLKGNGKTVAQAVAGTDYFPPTGGTITGDLTLSGTTRNIKYASGKRTGPAISMYAGDENGSGLVIGDGGRTIIGGGEAAQSLHGALTGAEGSEELHLANDGTIQLHTNCQTIANRRTFTFQNDGRLSGVANPTAATDVANKQYADTKQQKFVRQAVTLTVAGWNASAKTQTVTVSGVSATETDQLIFPVPALASRAAYQAAGIQATAQGANTVTFTAETIPTVALTVYVAVAKF